MVSSGPGRNVSLSEKTGIEVTLGTVDSGKEIRRLCDMGVNGIITNKPDLGSEIIDDGRTVYQ